MSSNIESVQVIAFCPNCGADGYEFDIEPDGLNAHHLDTCDECGRRVVVSVSVDVQSWES